MLSALRALWILLTHTFRRRETVIVEQRIEVRSLRHAARRHRVRVEIAVGALAHAPGQVDVQRQRRRREHHASSPGSVSAATSARRALPRWLIEFLCAASSSAAITSPSPTRNSGS